MSRQFDWNLRVSAWDRVIDMSPDIQALIQVVSLHFQAKGGEDLVDLPKLAPLRPARLAEKVVETSLKSSRMLRIADGQYVAEVNVTQRWKGFDVTSPPEFTWGLEVYGVHWDEAVNSVGADGRRKDWGPRLVHIWPGSGTLEERLRPLFHCILEIQGVLDALDAEEDEEDEEDKEDEEDEEEEEVGESSDLLI